MRKSILISGCTGFLGSHLLKKFLKNDFHPIILKRSFDSTKNIDSMIDHAELFDIDKGDFSEALSGKKIDIIIHLATNYGRSGDGFYKISETNIMLPLKLLEFGISNKAFHLSSL